MNNKSLLADFAWFGYCPLLVCGVLLVSAMPVLGQSAAGQAGAVTGAKSIELPSADQLPEIDGLLDEDIWSGAALVDDFHQMVPTEYAVPSQRTEVRVFYTEDALYVGARMYETDPSQITARILRQGEGLGPDDIIMIVIDPFFDRRNGYAFELNANGVRVEGVFQNVTSIQRDWEGIWEGATNIDEQGWTAEIRIPFQTISFDPDSSQWGINFRRSIRRNDEDIAWVSRNRQMNPSIAGTATGLQGLRQGIGLDVVPYLLARDERVFGTPGVREQSYEPQLDMFYKITSQMNASLTLNTDFSATDVDNRQVNLTRFSLFFPERRDFFLRDADIFEFGQISQNGRPFFSRRIGLSGSGAPVDINAGAKLSGRVGNWNLGSLYVSQGEDEANAIDAQNVFVGRASRNVLSESQVGMILTHGDPRSSLDNTVLGTDFRYRNSNLPGGRVLQGIAWYQQSDTEGVSGDEAAYGFGISSPNNQGWRGGYNYTRIENDFFPALGFVNQRGIEDHNADLGYRHFLAPGGYLRSLFVGAQTFSNSDLNTGDLIRGNTRMSFSVNNNTGDEISLGVRRNREVLDRDFTIYRATDSDRTITIPVGDYTVTQSRLNMNFANQRVLSGGYAISWGDFYEGYHIEHDVNVNWRPSRHYRFGIGYTEDQIELPQGNFTVRLATLSAQFAFNSTLSWSNLIQYDNVSEVVGFNSRLHWIPQAGRQAFLVLNYGLIDRDRDNHFESTHSDVTLKFSYTFRF